MLQRRVFRELCKRKERKMLKRFEEEVENVKMKEIWRIVNRERKRKIPIEEEIKIEEWENHFMQLLEGSKDDRIELIERRRREGDQEEEVKNKEIEEQIRKLKRKKAAGVDGIVS